MQGATTEMLRALGTRPVACSAGRDWQHVTAQRWQHGPLHDRTAPMAEHVVMTYLGAPQRIEARYDRRILRSSTRRGAITLIPAGHSAMWDIHGALDVIHAYIPVVRLAEVAAERGHRGTDLRPRVGQEDGELAHLLSMLGRCLDRTRNADPLFADQIADLICLHLLNGDHAALGAPARFRGGLSPTQLMRVTEFLAGSLAEPVTLQELAALVGLSRTHFCTAFKASTGMQPYAWRIAHRMARARDLLATTRMTVAEVAMAVGYDDPAYFSRLFRNHAGMPPMRYRQDCAGPVGDPPRH